MLVLPIVICFCILFVVGMIKPALIEYSTRVQVLWRTILVLPLVIIVYVWDRLDLTPASPAPEKCSLFKPTVPLAMADKLAISSECKVVLDEWVTEKNPIVAAKFGLSTDNLRKIRCDEPDGFSVLLTLDAEGKVYQIVSNGGIKDTTERTFKVLSGVERKQALSVLSMYAANFTAISITGKEALDKGWVPEQSFVVQDVEMFMYYNNNESKILIGIWQRPDPNTLCNQ